MAAYTRRIQLAQIPPVPENAFARTAACYQHDPDESLARKRRRRTRTSPPSQPLPMRPVPWSSTTWRSATRRPHCVRRSLVANPVLLLHPLWTRAPRCACSCWERVWPTCTRAQIDGVAASGYLIGELLRRACATDWSAVPRQEHGLPKTPRRRAVRPEPGHDCSDKRTYSGPAACKDSGTERGPAL